MKRYVSALLWFAALTGVVIPAYNSFFRRLLPPLFPEIGLLTTALGAATLFAMYALRPKNLPQPTLRRITRRGLLLITLSVILLSAFLTSLRAWTVKHPREDLLYQIGFRTASWTLTPAGQLDLQHVPSATPEDLMFLEAGFYDGGPSKIWEAWSIYATGAITLFLYLGGFVAWVAGFGNLAVVGQALKLTERDFPAQASPRRA